MAATSPLGARLLNGLPLSQLVRAAIEQTESEDLRSEIGLADLPSLALAALPAKAARGESLPTLDQAERDLIAAALQQYGKDKEKAARALGLTVRTFYRRLKKFGLS